MYSKSIFRVSECDFRVIADLTKICKLSVETIFRVSVCDLRVITDFTKTI